MYITNQFCYLEMMRSGSTHIHKMFKKFVPEGRQIGHHGPADINILKSNRKFVGSIRSPWSWYLSVWSFGCENGGHLHHRLTEKKIYFDQLGFRLKPYLFPYVFFQQFFKPLQKWRMLFSDSDNYENFRKFLKLIYSNKRVFDLGDGYALAARMESHNHPIYIDPFQGATTGVGGILRDIIAMGARPIALLDFIRLGTNEYNQNLLKPIIKGIADYGNCIGVPNVGGDLIRSDIYNMNPLLNVACVGIIKKDNIVYGSGKEEGLLMVYVGGRTGADGVGGAAMASAQFTDDTNINDLKDSIQKGDPFLEKLLFSKTVFNRLF